jgi:hypothetical protein
VLSTSILGKPEEGSVSDVKVFGDRWPHFRKAFGEFMQEKNIPTFKKLEDDLREGANYREGVGFLLYDSRTIPAAFLFAVDWVYGVDNKWSKRFAEAMVADARRRPPKPRRP